jgi:hypothetical protein
MKHGNSHESEFDGATGEHRAKYDWDTNGKPTMAVVEEVAAATGRDPNDLDPLATAVDTDALDALVTRANSTNGLTHVSFSYEGMNVTVDSGGLVLIEPRRS